MASFGPSGGPGTPHRAGGPIAPSVVISPSAPVSYTTNERSTVRFPTDAQLHMELIMLMSYSLSPAYSSSRSRRDDARRFGTSKGRTEVTPL
jgi:hypothetical protein